MTTDQIPLFAAPAAQPLPSPARPRPARRPAPALAPGEAPAAALPLPLIASSPEAAPPFPDGHEVCRTDDRGAPDSPEIAPPSPSGHEACIHQRVAAPPAADDDPVIVRSDRLWQAGGWSARVIKNEDGDGWAVEMLKDGEAEPALVGPWTMGRDKKNPKPLDQAAFDTLVKTATEVLQRHAQQAHAMLHKRLTVFALDAQWEIRLDITPDEYEPYATLSACDEGGDEVAQVRVPADFRLDMASAGAWITSGFARPEAATRAGEEWTG